LIQVSGAEVCSATRDPRTPVLAHDSLLQKNLYAIVRFIRIHSSLNVWSRRWIAAAAERRRKIEQYLESKGREIAAARPMSNATALLELIVSDLTHLGQPGVLAVLLQVLVIDITLAGDNAIVVGALAAGLPSAERRKVIAIGVLAALVLRVIFALIVTQLLEVVGLVLAGGVLLLWVAWRMWRELHHAGESPGSPAVTGDEHSDLRGAKSFAGAAWAVALADVSMSLDNVVGVASAARDHPGIMIIGLIGAVAMMGATGGWRGWASR
jgi:YjbE family integral membrane protein